MIGKYIGRYEIIEKLGEGGMGIVYLAEDLNLGRKTALKLLPPEVATDPERLSRLHREARAAAALNNPHVCTIYEAGEAEGNSFISMEYVEGTTLQEKIPAGGLPVSTVLTLGAQIAEGVAHAHEKGILHRDLKSSNVMITSDGRAKVMDFGLARPLQNTEVEELTHSIADLTVAGSVVGTLPYLAPEVLRGESATELSDIWAIGILLYEAVTGVLPFQGETGFALTSAIMTEQAPPLPPGTKAGLIAVIQRCLDKDPIQRYRSADQIRAALEALSSDVSIKPPVMSWVPVPGRGLWYALAVAGVLAASGIAWWISTSRPMKPNFLHVRNVTTERHVTSDENYTSHPSFSPDDNWIAFRWDAEPHGPGIYRISVEGGTPRLLVSDGFLPVWSPDGRWIAYLRERDEASFWIERISSGGEGESQQIGHSTTNPDGVALYWGLDWSPDGTALAIVDREAPEQPYGIYLLSLESGNKERKLILHQNKRETCCRSSHPTVGSWHFFDKLRFQRIATSTFSLWKVENCSGLPLTTARYAVSTGCRTASQLYSPPVATTVNCDCGGLPSEGIQFQSS